ncbi:hypothetical protein CUN59_07000 [Cuspidothrix issatschenkoi CHARLIE-1]|uniref:Uncharacterized protein n=1 Tax=Cuspidothrix issatschenkoi CHARLIE-1 TaxID=2052836 RepID=A0A2S6CWF9_9CYAN|nr:hypothetical protein CUN59_07000 [Cuspidothrix issatschenkoi CHARLIE-1]
MESITVYILLHIRINIEYAMLLMILVCILQIEVRNVGLIPIANTTKEKFAHGLLVLGRKSG